MNINEIKKEIMKDYPVLLRKAGYVANKIIKNFGPIKDKVVLKVFDYYSGNKNNWIYGLRITKKEIKVFMLTYHRDTNGLNAYGVFGDSDYVLHFSKHFFERYNEREEMGLEKLVDVMRAYVNSNFLYSLHKRKGTIAGNFKMFCITDKGLLLGSQDDKERIIHARTYLPFRLLNRSQYNSVLGGVKELVESIWNSHRAFLLSQNLSSISKPHLFFPVFSKTPPAKNPG